VTDQLLRLTHRETISWIVLDRPETRNALSRGLLDQLVRALDELEDSGAPVIGIRGAGPGFSSGYDLGVVGTAPVHHDPVADRDRLQGYVDTFWRLWDHPKPVIAAVHGFCLAGATQLCTYADLTVVEQDAQIGEPLLPIGGGFIAPLWAPLVGPKRAKELAFVPGSRISGTESVEWGWANHAVPTGTVVDVVEELASRIAGTPPDVLRIKKLSVNRALEAMGLREAAGHVAGMDALLHGSAEVVALKEWIADVGLKAAIAQFRDRDL
jgi:enoyl-CoA hydratase